LQLEKIKAPALYFFKLQARYAGEPEGLKRRLMPIAPKSSDSKQ
jgi:hypothetical protein